MLKHILLLSILTTNFAFSQINQVWQENSFRGHHGFEENRGQVVNQNGTFRDDVLYTYTDRNLKLILLKDGFSYQLSRFNEVNTISEATGTESDVQDYTVTIDRMDAKFKNMSLAAEVVAEGQSDEYSNYYLGRKAEYPTQVHKFSKVTYRNIYDKIDLVFSKLDKESPLRYEYIIYPGGDPKNISIQYKAANAMTKDANGNLVLSGILGFVREEKLVVFQGDISNRIGASFRLKNNILGFNISSYDRNQVLVIDPDISWGTYYGDDHKDDLPQECHIDHDGNILVTGLTASDMNFTTSGTYQTTYGGGNYDAFVIKWSPSGERIWSTYFGGSKIEQGFSIYTDAHNNVYSSGTTSSNNCPVFNAHQPNYGGLNDNYVLKLNKDGKIGWATYYGGSATEIQLGIYGDSKGNIYFSGVTYSTNNISTSGSFQPVKNLDGDGFVAKFDSNGNRIWATYYGGEGEDRFHSVTVDVNDYPILAGTTPSTTGIATPGVHQANVGGLVDGFIVKFSKSGQRLWGTYYGGPNEDHSRECDTDEEGNIYVIGFSNSETGISTPDAEQPEWVEGYKNDVALDDAFYAKLDPNGTLLYGTYLGGTGAELGLTIKLQHDGSVILSGTTQSPGLGTNGAYQSAFAGTQDIFLAKYNPEGKMSWFTYYGGNGGDEGEGMDVDESNNIYVCGHTNSFTGISTPGAFKTSITANAFDDGVFARFIDRCFDTYEPNNTNDSATQVNILPQNFALVQGEISSSVDNDFYAFSNAAAASNIMVTLTNLPKNYNLYLFKPSGGKAGQSINGKRKDEKIIFNTALTGNFKIRVQPGNSLAYTDTACYDLSIFLSNSPFKVDSELQDTEIGEENIVVFPNPATDEINLTLSTQYSEEITYIIYDLLGQIQYGPITSTTDDHRIDIKELKQGMYLLVGQDGDALYSCRFIVSR